MGKQYQHPVPVSDAQMVALLATLRVEPTPEADFETRFLTEFHERVAREAVCCPARRHLLAHLLQMLENVGRGRFAVGASVLGVGVVAACYSLFPASPSAMETNAAVAHEKQMSPLMIPALSHDLIDCTTVRVMPKQSVFEMGGITVIRGETATVIEVSHPSIQGGRSIDTNKGNRGMLPSSSTRYSF